MTIAFDAIGTHWHIDVPTVDNESAIAALVRDRVELFEATYSRFRPHSLVSRIAAQAGTYTLPEDANMLMDTYEYFYRATNGVLTPLIGSVMNEAGYDSAYSLTPKALHVPPAWDDVLEYDFPQLTAKQPVQLDFGALGKGYIIDIVSELLQANGIESFTINAGGDIRHYSNANEPIRIALENPSDTTQAIGVATIANKSLCGSAGNRRAWKHFHHIIHPHTLTSPRDILSTWVVADTTLLADAYVTALFLVPVDSIDCSTIEYAIVYADNSIKTSTAFPAELFIG